MRGTGVISLRCPVLLPDDTVNYIQTLKDFAWNTGAETALHAASKSGAAESVTLLLRANADPTIHDQMGRTPFAVAGGKEVRNAFRRHMADCPAQWDYHAAGVWYSFLPVALSNHPHLHLAQWDYHAAMVLLYPLCQGSPLPLTATHTYTQRYWNGRGVLFGFMSVLGLKPTPLVIQQHASQATLPLTATAIN
jgi:hypothetical protein